MKLNVSEMQQTENDRYTLKERLHKPDKGINNNHI